MNEIQQSYTASPIQFSASKLYFQHQNQMLQKIWFVSPMSIDIHFKYTFQEIQPQYFIEWWEFEGINVDHEVYEWWIIYKVWFLKPKFQNINHITLDLKTNVLDNPSILPVILWFIWRSIVFVVLFWLSNKYQVWKVLFWLNIIWAAILLGFYWWKFIKVIYKKIKMKSTEYNWLKASYTDPSDTSVLTDEVVKIIKKLWDDYWVTKFCCSGNCIYLLQDVHDRDWKRLNSTSKLYSEQEKANLQQKTRAYLNSSDFLSLFVWD